MPTVHGNPDRADGVSRKIAAPAAARPGPGLLPAHRPSDTPKGREPHGWLTPLAVRGSVVTCRQDAFAGSDLAPARSSAELSAVWALSLSAFAASAFAAAAAVTGAAAS